MTQFAKSEGITYVPGCEDAGWRSTAARLLHYSGLLRLLVASRASALISKNEYRCAILYYHRIGTGGVPVYNGIPAEIFEGQVKFLRQNYRILSLGDFCQELELEKSAPPAVVITFDDGYLGTYTEALPILKKYNVPATVYLTAGCIETGEIAWYDKVFLAFQVFQGDSVEIELDSQIQRFPLGSRRSRLGAAMKLIRRLRQLPNGERVAFCRDFEKRFSLPKSDTTGRMLTWEHIREMQKLGISFGGHTMTHPSVSMLSEREAEIELGESKALAESRLGRPVVDFAYPFGNLESCGTSTTALLRTYGYRSATTTVEGANSIGADPFLLRRTAVIEEAGVSLSMLRLNRLFQNGPIQRLKHFSSVEESSESRKMRA